MPEGTDPNLRLSPFVTAEEIAAGTGLSLEEVNLALGKLTAKGLLSPAQHRDEGGVAATSYAMDERPARLLMEVLAGGD